MYLIDKEYFTRDLMIPNINEAQSESLDNLESFVDEYSRQLLRDALGVSIFNDFDTYVVNGVFDELTAPQKYKDLVKGKVYTNNGITYNWGGLLQLQGVFKKSVLANYVYCQWFENSVTTASGVGEVTINAQNANLVPPIQRIVTYWNKFVQMHQGSYCNEPSKIYSNGVLFVDYYGNSSETDVSLIQYLHDQKEDFPDAKLRLYEFKNQLGL